MAAKKPKKMGGKISGAKLLALIVVGFFVFFALILTASYFANKPNYRDLESAYNQLNIPADWQQVSESSNKGTWGIFCWGNPGNTSPCPIKLNTYEPVNIPVDEKSTLKVANTIVGSGWQYVGLFDTEACDNQNESSYCAHLYTNQDISLSITFERKSGVTQAGIGLRQKDAL